jgi:hypothetical protein
MKSGLENGTTSRRDPGPISATDHSNKTIVAGGGTLHPRTGDVQISQDCAAQAICAGQQGLHCTLSPNAQATIISPKEHHIVGGGDPSKGLDAFKEQPRLEAPGVAHDFHQTPIVLGQDRTAQAHRSSLYGATCGHGRFHFNLAIAHVPQHDCLIGKATHNQLVATVQWIRIADSHRMHKCTCAQKFGALPTCLPASVQEDYSFTRLILAACVLAYGHQFCPRTGGIEFADGALNRFTRKTRDHFVFESVTTGPSHHHKAVPGGHSNLIPG